LISGEFGMSTAKDELKEILESQPEDSTTEELVLELAFHVMVQRGLTDSDAGRVVSNDEMGRRIHSWAQ
jgi:predicted transcriptional regulator